MLALWRTTLAVAICLGVPLATASPASAARTLAVTPSTDLVQAETVSVSGDGFNASVAVGFCQAIMDSTPSQSDCGGPVNTTGSSTSGAISFQYSVQQSMFVPSLGRTVNCLVETCVIAAAEISDIAGTATYSAPLTFVHVQPDGQIRHLSDNTVVFDDVYYPTEQVVSHPITPGADWSFAVQVQNDGARTDDITVTAAPLFSSSNVTVRYFAGWFDVTSSVTGTGFTFANVPPGEIRRLPVQFRANSGASVNSGSLQLLTFTSRTAPVIDRVKVGVRVVAPT